MPSWLQYLLGLPLVGGIVFWVLKVLNDRATGKSAEQRVLRREGAEVVTPARELAAMQLGPNAVAWGTDAQLAEQLRATHTEWWDRVRPALVTYGNHHPSESVRRLCRELADAVGNAMGATRYFLATRDTATTMDAIEGARDARDAAVAKADDLMDEIRGRRSRAWLGRG